MEDDDEFGDLYSDVLTPFSAFQPPSRSDPAPPPIDNTASAATTNASALSSGGTDLLSIPSSADSRPNININLNLDPKPNLNLPPPVQTQENSCSPSLVSRDPPLSGIHELPAVSADSSSLASHVEPDKTRVLENLDLDLSTVATEHGRDRILDQSAAYDALKAGNWGEQVEQDADAPVIPGISSVQPIDGAINLSAVSQEEANSQGDNWESDSEDDLQIVLNEDDRPDTHQYQGPMLMGDNGVKVDEDDDDEDEDGDPLVIVSDNDAVHLPPPEEQGWGEEAGQAADGEMKEPGEAGKANGGISLPPKVGYNNYGYHPYHSQFKYVRPGATPLPGGPGGAVQVRPPVSMGAVGGRGRGDWRQPGMKGPLQKGFQPGFWGGNASGRGFGGDFTLPSQKSIFDINIDTFEEKPWSHPGTDVSDFFNFGLDEDSWKEYCKKLEQLRMESTMKSKAHVLVVGSQSEQQYDPDLPPELAAAAAGIQDHSAENVNAQRADLGQSDIAKGSLMRPPLPTGRPILVEVGSGERLPSIDTRPPRMRDPDAVIEIVLQGSVDDDSSAVDGAIDRTGNDSSREDLRDDAVEEDGEQTGNEYSDGFPQSLDRRKRDDNVRRVPRVSASRGEDESSLPLKAPIEHSPRSRENSPVYLSDKVDASHEDRRMKGKVHERSRSTSPVDRAVDRRFSDDNEESTEDMEGRESRQSLSFEEKVLSDDEPFQTEGNDDQNENEDVNSAENTSDTSKHHSKRKLKLGSHAEDRAAKEIDDAGQVKAARSSDSSRATGASQDRPKGHKVVEEGVQDELSSHARDLKRNRRDDFPIHHRKDRDGSMETEKNNNLAKRRDSSYLHRDSDPYSPHGFDRRRERGYADDMLQQGGEDPHGRKYRVEDSRKNEHADGMIPRHRGRVREGERSNKDEYAPSKKILENGNWRGNHEKDAGFQIKEKDDILKTRYESMDDPYTKRRRDDEHARRDHFEKDEILHAHRDISSHRKRERDENLDHRKKDDHRSIRSKDEGWMQRERVEQRHRERDDGYRSKQSYEESLSRREREDGRAPIRSGRNVEDKGRASHSRKDDYKGYERDSSYKDTGRNGEQLKRKDRVEDASSLQYGFEEKRSRQEKQTARSDRAVHASDGQRAHERRAKENSRKPKQLEGGQQSTSNSSKKPQEDKSGRNEMVGLIGTSEEGNAEKIEDALEDDEQRRSKRGRSKLERWSSHQERDYNMNNKPSSSLKLDSGRDSNQGAGHSIKVSDDPAKKSEAVDISHPASEVKESDTKQTDSQHLDTVAKLKKRSERFKLPMPSEKDTTSIKKTENEPLTSAPSEAAPVANSELKQERPPRKRRWISS